MRRNYPQSTCCGAECTMPEVGICPDCLEHCDWEEINEDDEPTDHENMNSGNMEGGISYTQPQWQGR